MKLSLLNLLMIVSRKLLHVFLVQVIAIHLLMAETSNGQKLEDVKIDFVIKDAQLKKIFHELEQKTQFYFGYNKKVLSSKIKLSFNEKKISVRDILWQIAGQAELRFKRINNQILVLKDQKESRTKIEVLQEKNIRGKIIDANTNEMLVGATVMVKGTYLGTITDTEGKFSLSVPEDAQVLVFSYVGYSSTEIPIGSRTVFDVSLEPDLTNLDEIVVVGYGVQNKSNLTGAVANVSGEKINQRPITQGTQALQGLIPGVFVNTNDGEPGNDDASIVIRGIGTLNQAEPLVLIDGIEAPLANLNPNDIETVNVLKDAASASIYGTRAANGVILITTKRGKYGKPMINYNGSYSITRPTVLPKFVYDTRTYLETYNKAQEYAGRTTPFTSEVIDELSALPNTNWIEKFVETGAVQNHDVSISGGTDNVKYRFSTRYLDQEGYLKGDWYTKRLNTRLNLDAKLSEKVNVGASMAFVNTDNRQASKNDPGQNLGNEGTVDRYGGKGNFLYQILLVCPPNMPIYDEFGRYAGTGSESSKSQRDNPQGLIDNQWISIDRNEYFGNAFIEIEPINDLKFKYTSGINAQQESFESFALQYEQYDRFGNQSAVRVPGSLLSTRESSLLNFTNWLQVAYSRSFGRHNLNLMAGINQETSTIRRIGTYEQGFGSTALVKVGNGTESIDIANYNGEWILQSIFSRFNYNFDNKYLLEVNVRRDGSSRFGANNRWATFPGVSAGYVISEEEFWNLDFISQLKIRASWGKLGVQSVNLYPYASELLLGRDYNGNSGAALTKLGNPDLEWEETTTKDLGFDLELLRGKVYLEGDYFIKESTGILTDLENPLTSGITSEISVNSAQIVNKGWEIILKTNNNLGDIRISTGINLTHVQNEITQINPSLTNQDDKVQVSTGDNVWWIRGEPINSMYGHEFGGVFQVEEFNADGGLVSGVDYSWIGTPRPGDIKYVDQNGDKVINEEDMVVIGNRNPEWLYGINIDLNYKGFDLGIFLQGVGKMNGYINRYTGNYGHSGLREFWLNSWTEENRSNTIPRIFVDRDGFNGSSIAGNGGLAQSSFWVTDQSYLRLKNIVFGYTLPSQLLEKLSIERARFYVSGQNILTFSKLDDLDPERNPYANHFGGTLPQAKAVTFGINLTF